MSALRVDIYELTDGLQVVNGLSNFANITLSALYFDITKDCLYANDPLSIERRRVVTVLQQVDHIFSRVVYNCLMLIYRIHRFSTQ